MKFCKDCRYYCKGIESSKIYVGARCSPPSVVVEFDPVTGNEISKSYEPRAARKDESLCGMEAKWFDAGESVFEAILRKVTK